MGRKDFIAHLDAAAKNSPVPNISNLHMSEDGETLTFQLSHGFGKVTTFNALMTEPASYPKGNSYFLSADDAIVTQALQGSSFEGLTITGLVTKVSSVVGSLGDGTAGSPMILDTPPGSPSHAGLSTGGSGTSQPEDDDDEDDNSHDDDVDLDWFSSALPAVSAVDGATMENRRYLDPQSAAKLNRRIIDDLKRLRMAGFRVGIIKGMKADSVNSILSISLRVAKLRLSDEVLQAWNLERHHYIVLLIQYSDGYRTFEDVLDNPAKDAKVSFRMGVNNRYKPTIDEAIAALSAVRRDAPVKGQPRTGGNSGCRSPTKGSSRSRSRSPAKGTSRSVSPRRKRFADWLPDQDVDLGFRLCFISSPMRQLMDDSFLKLAKIRYNFGCGWEGANHHLQERKRMTQMADKHDYVQFEESPSKKQLPDIVTADHLKEHGETMSLPLVAMQFAMFYLMRCTEFCLVCHKKTEESFEAIKPYVCSNPLCLYQYMSLGFGPSIEHEILSQPYVVDLLISFCYSAAIGDRLRSYPDGMGLFTPPPPPAVVEPFIARYPEAYPVSVYEPRAKDEAPVNQFRDAWSAMQHNVRFDIPRRLIELDLGDTCKNLRTGDWIQLNIDDVNGKRTVHYRVEKYMHPFIHIVDAMGPETPKLGATPDLLSGEWRNSAEKSTENPGSPKKDSGSRLSQHGIMSLYSLHFDEQHLGIKSAIIVELLQTLPSVQEMAEYLSHNGAREARLMGWVDRISPAALGLLRWIVASNRSCIVQVDQAPSQTTAEAASRGVRLEQKLTGLSDWMQFRFAQGAPDKEDKFHKALAAKKDVTGQFESIFAWHGSALPNWHSIIRTGLDFSETLNGRAYGHGVYFASQFETSLGYTHSGRLQNGALLGIANIPAMWPQSSLKIASAICLNEIVNAPAEFASRAPYLVVQFTEWIQCRYLLVKCLSDDTEHAGADPISTTRRKPAAAAQMASQQQDTQVPGQMKIRKKDPSGPFIVQDPSLPIVASGKKVQIPRSAFPASRNFKASKDGSDYDVGNLPSSAAEDGFEDNTPRKKKRKSANGRALTLSLGNGKAAKEVLSDDSDVEDIAFFHSEDEVKDASQSFSGLGLSTPNGKAKGMLTHDDQGKPFTDFVPGSLDRSTILQLAPPSYGTSTSNRRLQQDLRALLAVQSSTPLHELGWYIDGASISNLYQWIIELHSFPSALPLAQDMKRAGATSVVLELRFGAAYPMEPPFVRVVRPRFLPFAQGGGGHVTAGGALCMELLTNSGWSAVSTIESVLLQVRMAIMSTDPKPARVGGGPDYGVGEAVEAYERACRLHGWKFPDMRGVGGEEVLGGMGADGALDSGERYVKGDLMSSMDRRGRGGGGRGGVGGGFGGGGGADSRA